VPIIIFLPKVGTTRGAVLVMEMPSSPASSILCGVLSGGAYADMVDTRGPGGAGQPAQVAHFFMALNIENFVEMDIFREKMDDLIDRLKESEKAEGQERIFVHGEKEYELYEKHKASGVPLEENVYSGLKAIAGERGVAFEL